MGRGEVRFGRISGPFPPAVTSRSLLSALTAAIGCDPGLSCGAKRARHADQDAPENHEARHGLEGPGDEQPKLLFQHGIERNTHRPTLCNTLWSHWLPTARARLSFSCDRGRSAQGGEAPRRAVDARCGLGEGVHWGYHRPAIASMHAYGTSPSPTDTLQPVPFL